MLLYLTEYLTQFESGFNVFSYLTLRAILGALTALILSFVIGPRMIAKLSLSQLGQPVREQGPSSHLPKAGTPTMGGALILTAIVVSEPGLYDVQAVVSLFNDSLNRNLIVPSNVMRVRIGTPHSPDDENDALVMFRDDVGAYLALGGSRVLDKAHDDLQAILARRSDDSLEPVDSVCANIIRCAGIDAGRNYQLQRKLDRGDRKVAADLLEKLDTATLQQYFDVDTATSTASLAKKHRDAT